MDFMPLEVGYLILSWVALCNVGKKTPRFGKPDKYECESKS